MSQKYTSSLKGTSFEFEPAYPYNSYIEGGKSIYAFEPERIKEDYVILCTDSKYPVVSTSYALSIYNFGPRAHGSICNDTPLVSLYAWPRGNWRNDLSGVTSTKLAQGEILGGDFEVNVKKWLELSWVWSERMEQLKDIKPLSHFDASVFLIIKTIEKTCKKLPSQINIVVAIGKNKEESIFNPEYVFITANNSANGWSFIFDNLQRANEILEQGETEIDARIATFEREYYEAAKRREAWIKQMTAPRTPEERFAIGATIVLGIMGGMGVLSPCFNEDPLDDYIDCQ
ncbi:hypothetical protein J7481_11395 [Labrenzia sp. R4_2]|uniref:hypothetical protein n=1 Tax=Labrenzia sp. R4_2 TaxID=2821107 RepID=UPI001ADBFCF3|nr:hypothetical protein [Labrenzia sp. R4_2]MBO9420102.1 hypothetical protein [Labrenzia sp. R4_2]